MLGLVDERAPLRRGQLRSRATKETMADDEPTKSTLLLWLNLLGWQVDVRRKGAGLIGVARHVAADGSTYRVSGNADTRDALAFQLFEAALRGDRGRLAASPLARRLAPAARAAAKRGSIAGMASPERIVVFVHGLWLHADSWTPWVELLPRGRLRADRARLARRQRVTVEETRRNPEAVAGLRHRRRRRPLRGHRSRRSTRSRS